ncbi:hypothetical protein HXX76_011336 [Chlamydomonas incerta]|uniref:Uncharacterized protein n=1 Tax=Chlamydomonas incerta TaxID=51695 RepID=A0A835T060_CHLIN|nr:hypothetical protein HXX76_011336 [Chlamydomonas incerta]|eukprot:KAG2429096.1 hypothetical protein HXX76_011336 [Chlamydomonas incerta]
MRESHACATPEAARAEDVDAVEQRTRAYLSRHGLRVRPMEEREVAAVLTADRAIYNTSSPARLDTIQEWCAKVPDWGFVLEATASASPSPSSPSQALRPHPHTRLVHDPDAPGHGRMGLHIYHMERAPAYPPHLPTFGLVALYGNRAGHVRGGAAAGSAPASPGRCGCSARSSRNRSSKEQEPQRRRELTRAQAAVQGSGGGCCEQPAVLGRERGQ